jgi:sulfatase modifying factor 1
MSNLFSLFIVTLCLMWMPAHAQDTSSGSGAKPAKTVHVPKAGHEFRDCPSCPTMVVIPSGSFNMGSPGSEAGRGDNEGPVHQVNITAFALGKNVVTMGQFAAFVKETNYSTDNKCWTLVSGEYKEHVGNWRTPGYPQNAKHPVTCVNWNDAQAYAKWLSHKTGKKYRLPTEAEWEYSARGNTSTARYWGNNPDEACGYANVADQTAQAQIEGATSWSVHNCSDGFSYTAPVGSFKANTFGLYDMLGNVWEWTEDSYHDSYKGAPTDGSSWLGNGAKHVLRGGSWNNSARDVRAAVRCSNKPGLDFSIFGFRVARMIP